MAVSYLGIKRKISIGDVEEERMLFLFEVVLLDVGLVEFSV